MKSVIIAFVLLAVTLSAVITNSFILKNSFNKLTEDVQSVDDEDLAAAHEKYTEIFDNFKKKEWYISLTVNHEDLTSVEDALSEITGAAEAGDGDAVMTIKSRLINSLEHLSRLSGINMESIF